MLLAWLVLLVQLVLGVLTIFVSLQHLDGGVIMKLAEWAQREMTFRTGGPELVAGESWVFKTHMVLGMTLFLIFPFTRLVHIWSGFGTLAYLRRPYQMVRARRMNVPAGNGTASRGDRAA